MMLAARFLAKDSPSHCVPRSAGSATYLSLYRVTNQSSVETPAEPLMAHLLLSMTLAPFARAKLPQKGKKTGSVAKPKISVWPPPEVLSLTQAAKSSRVQPALGGVLTMSVL